MCKRLLVLAVVAGVMMVAGAAGGATLVSLWNFNGDLTAEVGSDLTAHAGQEGYWAFENTSQYGDWARFPDGQHGNIIRVFGERMLDGFHAPSDLSQQYQYTVVMDILNLPPGGWTGNAWRSGGGVFDAEILGSYHQVYQGAGWENLSTTGSGVFRDTWQRFVYTIDTGNEVAVYQNGSLIGSRPNNDALTPGSWWYAGNGFDLVFNLYDVFVGSAAIYDGILTPQEIVALGSPSSTGIPEPGALALLGAGAVGLLRRRRGK